MARWTRSREAVVATSVVALAVVALSWPLAWASPATVTAPLSSTDLAYTLFAHRWAWEVMAGRESFWHSALMAYPEGLAVGPGLWNPVVLFATSWLQALSEPLPAYARAVVLLQVLNGLALYVLGRRLGGPLGGALAASVGLLLPFTWHEHFEGRLEQGFIAPAALYLAWVPEVEERPVRVGAAMALAAACYWFTAPMLALATLPLLGRRLLRPETWRALLVAVGLSVLLAAPVAALVVLPQLDRPEVLATFSDARMVRVRLAESWPALASVAWLGPGTRPVGKLALGALALGALALWRAPGARAWLLVGLLGLVMAAGPLLQWGGEPVVLGGRHVALPLGWLDLLPGMSRMWWPYRWLLLTVLSLAAAAALVAPRLPRPAVALLGLLLVVEGLALWPVRGTPAHLQSSPRALLDPVPDGRYLRLPLAQERAGLPADGEPVHFVSGGVLGEVPLVLTALTGQPTSSADAGLGGRVVAEQVALSAAWEDPSRACELRWSDLAHLAEAGFTWLAVVEPMPGRAQGCLQRHLGPAEARAAGVLFWRVAEEADEALRGPGSVRDR